MAKSKKFGSMLKDAVYRIKSKESNKSIQTIQDELGYALGKKGNSAIEYWRQGNIPIGSDLENLTQEIVKHTDFDREWIEEFLDNGQHPQPKQLSEKLIPTHIQSFNICPYLDPTLDTEVIKEALKQWHGASHEPSTLEGWYLYRKAFQNGIRTPRQAVNQVLMNALLLLGRIHPIDAELIEMRFWDLQPMHLLANHFNVADSTIYIMQRHAIRHLTEIINEQEKKAYAKLRVILSERLPPPTYSNLIGVQAHVEHLESVLSMPEPPWLIAIEGMGGIGKTSLADILLRKMLGSNAFAQVGWVSARQHNFNLIGEIEEIQSPALTAEVLIDTLIRQILPEYASTTNLPLERRISVLRRHLEDVPHLIVVDNLETVIDVETLLPTLQQLANPTKFVLTSRAYVSAAPTVYRFKVPGLNLPEALKLIRQEAQFAHLPMLAECSDDELRPIYEIVGGNPLAIRLIVGQVHTHPLYEVLNGLKEAMGMPANDFYTFVYLKAWRSLPTQSQEIFLLMALTGQQGEDLDYLMEISGKDRNTLYTALSKLVILNLVDAYGGVNERLYKLHNLTRTFLYKQVLNWSQGVYPNEREKKIISSESNTRELKALYSEKKAFGIGERTSSLVS